MGEVRQEVRSAGGDRDLTRIVFELLGPPARAVEVAAEMVPALRGRGFVVRAATAGDIDVLALAP